MRFIGSIFLALSLLGCGGCAEKLSSGEVDSVVEEDVREWETWDSCSHIPGDHPCNFSLLNQHGDAVELYDYYGKVVVIDLSAMWCGICQHIAAKGEELTETYGSENFVWLTILVENESGLAPSQNDLQRWADSYQLDGNILGGDRSLVDPSGITGYPVSGWPTVVVIDQEMVISNGVNGWSESLVTSWVEDLL